MEEAALFLYFDLPNIVFCAVCDVVSSVCQQPIDTCLEERGVCELQSECCDDLVCRGTPDFAPEFVKRESL